LYVLAASVPGSDGSEVFPLSYELVDDFLTDVPGEKDWGKVMIDLFEYFDTEDWIAPGITRGAGGDVVHKTHNDPTRTARIIDL